MKYGRIFLVNKFKEQKKYFLFQRLTFKTKHKTSEISKQQQPTVGSQHFAMQYHMMFFGSQPFQLSVFWRLFSKSRDGHDLYIDRYCLCYIENPTYDFIPKNKKELHEGPIFCSGNRAQICVIIMSYLNIYYFFFQYLIKKYFNQNYNFKNNKLTTIKYIKN